MGKLIAVDRCEAEEYKSPYGNEVFTINDELFSALKQGKVLVDDDCGEYGTVIEMEEKIVLADLNIMEVFRSVVKGMTYFTIPIQDISEISTIDIECDVYTKAAWAAIALFKEKISQKEK